jgi:hypothetical protein
MSLLLFIARECIVSQEQYNPLNSEGYMKLSTLPEEFGFVSLFQSRMKTFQRENVNFNSIDIMMSQSITK